jgi:hypothetical protein
MKRVPRRIQRNGYCDYSWQLNPNAVYVGRPTKWGNPYKLTEYSLDLALFYYEIWLKEQLKKDPNFLKQLVGKDLVCFCPLDKSCHADILMDYCKKEEEKEN